MSSAVSVDPLRRAVHQAWADLAAAGLRQAVPGPVNVEQPEQLQGWVPVDRLHRTDTWRALADAYSADLGTPHRAVGAACGLQHYCGRLVLAVLGVWVQTGVVLRLDADRWWAFLDDAGHTVAVDARLRAGVEHAPLAEAIDLLRGHVAPVAEAAGQAGHLTPRLAWGSLATSCAGALGRLQRTVDEAAAARRLATLTDAALTGAEWGTGRALVSCRTEPGPYGPRLVHERHTCCLIRLGREHATCGTCPQQPESDRRRAAREVIAMPAPDRRLATRFPS